MNKVARFLIFFAISALILLILVTIILPSTGKVMKEKNINARRAIVLDELTNIRSYTLWYPWLQMDPGVRIHYHTGGKSLSWQSDQNEKNVGTYEVTGREGDSIVYFQLNYGSTPPVKGGYILRSSDDGTQTDVVWYMNMDAGWTPWWRFYAATMGKLTGPLLETGLTNLKVVCEKQMLLPAE